MSAMDIMTEMCKELTGVLTDVGTNLHKRKLVMLSHDDLDGIGCSILMGHVTEQYRNNYDLKTTRMIGRSVESFFTMRDIQATVTSHFVPDLYEDLNQLIIAATSSPEHHRLIVLITDLGNITIEELYKRYRNTNRGDIIFIVVDHHKHPYDTADEVPMTEKVIGNDKFLRRYMLDRDPEANSTLTYFEEGPLFRCYLWEGYNGKSATAMLASMLKMGGVYPLTQNVMNWAELVSTYDTGHWGTWYIPTDTKDPKAFYNTKVAPEIKLFLTWSLFNDIPGTNKYDHLSTVMQNMIRYLNEDNDFLKDQKEPDAVYSVIRQLARKYEMFIEKIDPCRICPPFGSSSTDLLCSFREVNAASFSIPKSEYLGCGFADTDQPMSNIRVLMNDESTVTWPLSLFSKQLLETEYDDPAGPKLIIALTVSAKRNDVRVELRSAGQVNCYNIAKANGGGGHLRAAGFRLPLMGGEING